MAHLALGIACASLSNFGDETAALSDDLIDTMRASPACVGIAAPQIGVNLRAFVVDCSAHKKATTHHDLFVMFNPVIVARDGEIELREGCMSVPDLTGDVRRAERIVVEGFDARGAPVRIETEGFEARAIQHEVDHLDGLLFLDRLTGPEALHQRRVYR